MDLGNSAVVSSLWDLKSRALLTASRARVVGGNLDVVRVELVELAEQISELATRVEREIAFTDEESELRKVFEAAGTEGAPLSLTDVRAIVEVAHGELCPDEDDTQLFRWSPNRRLSKGRWTRLSSIDGFEDVHWCSDPVAGWLAAVPEHIAKVARRVDQDWSAGVFSDVGLAVGQ